MKWWAMIVIAVLVSCDLSKEVDLEDEDNQELDPATCGAQVIVDGEYYEQNGRQYLGDTQDSTLRFDITGWSLNVCHVRHGLGRETFQALISPKYDRVSEVIDRHDPEESAVVVKDQGNVKVYPLLTLINHEAINDVANGEPIVVVFCYLADLVTVYSRNYCNRTLTFGVTGYTYADPNIRGGLESFLLWDRNSESVWWPILDQGVSGAFKGYRMVKYNSREWDIMTMGEIGEKYPDGLVVKKGQTVDPPNFGKWTGC
ncbi:DUF3179 domain-containing (seleno)protein [Marinoscillum furvescens]|uniref:Uncharacterized protein DUF3179 n=1 Tax=Marinoscillum furvescens DSM 4134 TaxID=1122208 RepID=A0A3D9LGD5_MARFU|nr:DUF3179 domain-containing (seleno)protein [Marinoscillum furvescens]REE05667.1 uncharacterized protein DUF3179 [Marinoscillum furvescens DSM 4134]